MIKSIAAACALALAALTTTPAFAQNLTAANPQGIVKVFQDAGYKAQLDKDGDGRPLIRSSSNGSNFILFFLTCEDGGKNCKTLQFYAGYEDQASLAKLNAWNSDNRFARAYQSDKGASRIEMDLDMDMGGMSAALFKDNLDVWIALMAQFEKHLAAK